MKKKNSALWQKRNEWRITDDAQTDWQQMQGLLDSQMPVANTVSGSGTGIGSTLARLGKFKLWITAAVTISAAALVVYYFAHKNTADHQLKHNAAQATHTTANNINNTTNEHNVITNKADNKAPTNGHSIDLEESGNNNINPIGNRTANNSPATTQAGSSAANTSPANGNLRVNNHAASLPATSGVNTSPGNSSVKTGTILQSSADINTTNHAAKNSTTGSNTTIKPIVNANGKQLVANNNLAAKRGVNNNAVKINNHSATSNRDPHNLSGTNNTNLPDANNNRNKATANINKTHSAPLAANNSNKVNVSIGGTRAPSRRILNGYNKMRISKGSVFTATAIKNRNYIAGANKIIPSNYNKHDRIRYNKLWNTLKYSTRQNSDHQNIGFDKNTDQTIAGANSSTHSTTQSESNVLTTVTPKPDFVQNNKLIATKIPSAKPSQITSLNTPLIDKKSKDQKLKPTTASGLDWGLLMGANQSGSFTAKSQNANFYGSLPVDTYFGLFATYNIKNHWGVNLEIKGLSPQMVSGTYSRPNETKADSGQVSVVTDSRKVYFVDIPLHLVYRPTPYLSLKAGPVLSVPVKDAFGNPSLNYGKAHKDSAYYVKVTNLANATKYNKATNLGVSGGITLQYSRFLLEATYLKSFKPQTVSSDLGSYSFNYNALQFTLGFKLNKPK